MWQIARLEAPPQVGGKQENGSLQIKDNTLMAFMYAQKICGLARIYLCIQKGHQTTTFCL